MATDFRSDPMESREGKGLARRAWDKYASTMKKYGGPVLDPLLTPIFRPIAGRMAVDLVGFWAVWHLHGGFEGLKKLGLSDVTIYRKLKLFRTAYHAHPDEYAFPGITLDPEAYWSGGKKGVKKAAKVK